MSSENDKLLKCPNCKNDIDHCTCGCPYCGQKEGCDCAIGYGVATGG